MSAYIGRIQDANNDDVYPQTMVEGVLGLSDKLDKLTGDNGWQSSGITFSNGAYDWGVKNGGTPSSKYRTITIGKIKFTEIRAVFAINTEIGTDYTTAIFYPASALPAGGEDVQYWSPIGGVSHYNMLLRFHNTGGFSVCAMSGKLPANTMMSFHTFVITS